MQVVCYICRNHINLLMNKKILLAATLLVGLNACSDKDDSRSVTFSDGSIKFTIENPEKWSAYASDIASAIEQRAADLLQTWEGQVADEFKAREASESVQKIVDGCVLTASTVATGKVDDPLTLLIGGYGTQIATALDIWFGQHTKEDYAANILSIRNVYFGSLTGEVNPDSPAAVAAQLNPAANQRVLVALQRTLAAIQSSPDGSTLSADAMAAASELAEALGAVKPVLAGAPAEKAEAIVADYVDGVVVPSYRTLAGGASALADAGRALAANPNDETFTAFTTVWHQARLGLALTAAFVL